MLVNCSNISRSCCVAILDRMQLGYMYKQGALATWGTRPRIQQFCVMGYTVCHRMQQGERVSWRICHRMQEGECVSWGICHNLGIYKQGEHWSAWGIRHRMQHSCVMGYTYSMSQNVGRCVCVMVVSWGIQQGGVILKNKKLYILSCAKLLQDPNSKISYLSVASFLGRKASENLGCYIK